MTLTLEQFRELLVDYLYGQLEGEQLRAFEACLHESAECRRELAALESTLLTARAELREVGDEAPPARVRVAVLAAAHAHAKSVEPAAPVVQAARRPRTQGSESEAGSGFRSWLRTPWLVPTLGVAAAVALLVLNKDVEPLHSKSDSSAETQAAPSATPVTPEHAPAPESPAPSAQETSGKADPEPEVEEQKRAEAPATRAAAKPSAPGRGAASKGYAAPPASWARTRAADKSRASNVAPSDGYAESESARTDDLTGALGPAEERSHAPMQDSAPAASSAVRRDKAASLEARGSVREQAVEARSYASQPSSPRAGAPAPVRPMSEGGGALGAGSGAGSYGAASAPAPAAAPSRSASGPSGGVVADESADRKSESPPKKKSETVATRDQLLERARESTAAQRWAPAIESYRELLRRFPKDTQVANWRKQIRLLQSAQDLGHKSVQ